ncbi:MAG TPA: threonine/serine dehydratase [Blastocatellia bacterium]|nr:threonine/serine dehydratase [Blastocatellia bacterium]
MNTVSANSFGAEAAEPGLNDIESAAARIKTIAMRTPLEQSRWLSNADQQVFLKLECFQPTGSFKLRGAAAKLTALSVDEKQRGILTVSAGNHGLAVAHCSSLLSLDATIVVPRTASRAKVESIRRYPVKLLEKGETYDDAERDARRMQAESEMTFVSPYNDREVIAGQGTVALEILDELAGCDSIVAPVGGGGLIAGIAIAAKARNPRIKIYGVEPETSPTMTRALEAGRILQIEEAPTIADGLAGNIETDSITFPIVQRLVDGMIIVSERALKESLLRVALEDHIMIEGSAAASIAALGDSRLRTGIIAAVVTGRNISLDLFSELITNR